MKRVYQRAAAVAVEGRHRVMLDAKPLRSPAGQVLELPTAALAAAVAAEWQAQDDEIVVATLALTRLACTVVDRIVPDRASLERAIVAFAETDLLCYRAEGPQALVARQQRIWQPLIDWATLRFDAPLVPVAGVMHRPQPPAAVAALGAAVAAVADPWRLLVLHEVATISGSLVLGLALFERHLATDEVWRAAQLDEDFQIERWGEDPEATRRRAGLRADLEAAVQLLDLLDS
jgi:chaperone required for assembly of F1-ATPase